MDIDKQEDLHYEGKHTSTGLRIHCHISYKNVLYYNTTFIMGNDDRFLSHIGINDLLDHFIYMQVYVWDLEKNKERLLIAGSCSFVAQCILNSARDNIGIESIIFEEDDERMDIKNPFQVFISARTLCLKLKEKMHEFISIAINNASRENPEVKRNKVIDVGTIHNIFHSNLYRSIEFMRYLELLGLINSNEVEKYVTTEMKNTIH